mgnify:CR=1 FL=1
MIFRNVTAYGRPATIACDARCDKAWGWNARPKVQLSDDPDDVEWLADGELGDAPTVSSISEGGDGKPQHPSERLNKWCFRECERCGWHEGHDQPVPLRDWSKRRLNIPRGRTSDDA